VASGGVAHGEVKAAVDLGVLESGPSVTVGIVNFEGASLTLRALEQVLAQKGAPAFDVVIVDNGSSDQDFARLASGVGSDTRLVRLATNRGYAAACNAVARIAFEQRSTFVWFLNNDVDMADDLLARLSGHLGTDRSIGAVAPVTVDARDGQTVLGAGASITPWRGKLAHRYQGRPVGELPRDAYEVEAIEGAGPLIRTSALGHVGGWDEGFFMYWEDAEWSVRARRSGLRLIVAPDAFLRHSVSASSASNERQGLMIRNRLRFVRIAGAGWVQPLFLVYLTAIWLPAYYVTRLAPRYGIGQAARIAIQGVAWNVRDALRRRRWRLRRSDQDIPSLA
jgi:GT2 family glycosyltransferase